MGRVSINIDKSLSTGKREVLIGRSVAACQVVVDA